MSDRRGPNVDRERTCPFLLHVLVRTTPSTERDFRPPPTPSSLHSIYTWRDCTLRDLVLQLRDSTPSLRLPLAKYSFRLVLYDERSDRWIFRDLGVVHARDLGTRGGQGERTLEDGRFVVGDYVECVGRLVDLVLAEEGEVVQVARGGTQIEMRRLGDQREGWVGEGIGMEGLGEVVEVVDSVVVEGELAGELEEDRVGVDGGDVEKMLGGATRRRGES
ncbi:hypothetical protein BT69DRAFT_1294847 [Atractiella rhizophila]|nr:hypothetical protein BT69DRAFT_1294847 [Atractiella rhizophila]